MKIDLTHLSDEAAVVQAVRYIAERTAKRNRGKLVISALDLAANFKHRRLVDHNLRLNYFSGLLKSALTHISAAQVATRILQAAVPVEGKQ